MTDGGLAGVAVRSRTAAFLEPLSHRSYRLLWASQVTSDVGTWASRLALTALVYERTDSSLLSALGYVLSLVPWIGIGQWLSTCADRFGRKQTMIVCDLVSAAAFAALCLPVPVVVLLLLTFVAGLPTPAFAAARSAALVESVPEGHVAGAIALNHSTSDLAVVGGYLVGGVMLAATGPTEALLANALTFVISALFISRLPRLTRPAKTAGAVAMLQRAAGTLVSPSVYRRAVVVATIAAGAATATEALVVPHVAESLPGQEWATGVTLASVAVLTLVGTVALPSTLSTEQRLRLCFVLTAAVSLAAILLLVSPVPWAATVGFVLVGGLFLPLMLANMVLAPLLPRDYRASIFSLLMGSLVVTQTGFSLIAGMLALRTSPAAAAATMVAVSGLAGAVALLMSPVAGAAFRSDG